MAAHVLFLLSLLLSGCSILGWDKGGSREVASVEEAEPQPNQKEAAAFPDLSKRTSQGSATQSLRKRVLVLPFKNESTLTSPELTQYATEEVRNQLSNVPEFIVVRDQDAPIASLLNSVPNEADLVPLIDAARAHGIIALVLGAVKDVRIKERGNQVGLFQTRYNTVQVKLEVKLLDITTQKFSVTKELNAEVTEENTRFFGSRSLASTDAIKAEGAITKAVEQMVPTFSSEAHRIGWSGRIAKIDIHRYYINAGELSGVSRNQLLRVFGDAEPVVDKESGLVIGMAPGRFKGLLKVVDFFGEDGAIAVVHSGAGFQERDRVESYVAPAP